MRRQTFPFKHDCTEISQEAWKWSQVAYIWYNEQHKTIKTSLCQKRSQDGLKQHSKGGYLKIIPFLILGMVL